MVMFCVHVCRLWKPSSAIPSELPWLLVLRWSALPPPPILPCSLSSLTPPLLPSLLPPSPLPTYREEIAYLMECADTNKDGLLDYKEFTERFHQPAESIGFHLCVLIVHLSDHLPQDRRLERFKCSPQGRELMEHFQCNMGCIEILGKSKRIERVYFEVKESWLQQWEEAQIQESKWTFLQSVEMGSQKKKLEGFISFCEDTIFEVSTIILEHHKMIVSCRT